ncbi:hypothetical protein KC901_01895 [Patescibacteria group bacterium]|nr:hypothetical protein [Patescibacteria group bacterium]
MNPFENNFDAIQEAARKQGKELYHDDKKKETLKKQPKSRHELDLELIAKLNVHIQKAEEMLKHETDRYKREELEEDIKIQTKTLEELSQKFSDDEIKQYLES